MLQQFMRVKRPINAPSVVDALEENIVAIHDGDTDTKFKYEVVKVFQKDVLSRQLQEGMRIENQTGISLNSQNEWQAPAVI